MSKYKNPFEGPFKVVKDKKIKIVKRKSAYSSKPLPNDKRKKKSEPDDGWSGIV